MSMILFEEPEAFLHPPQQEILAHSLVTLASNPDQQVICSTHSSHFVSRNAAHIPSIGRLKRENGRVSIHQIGTKDWDDLVDANHVLNRIAAKWPKLKQKLDADDEKPEMEAVKYFLWLNPDRCGMFFANHVVIVEGPTEQSFVNRLIGDGRIKRPHDGLYVLDTIGKFNIHRFMNLLSQLGISHSVLHDDNNNVNHHADVNQLIQDSKHETLTFAVKSITRDLVQHRRGSPGGKRGDRLPPG